MSLQIYFVDEHCLFSSPNAFAVTAVAFARFPSAVEITFLFAALGCNTMFKVQDTKNFHMIFGILSALLVYGQNIWELLHDFASNCMINQRKKTIFLLLLGGLLNEASHWFC